MNTDAHSPQTEAGIDADLDASLDTHYPESVCRDVRAMIPMYYQDLRKIAHLQRRKLAPYSTLNTTGVVHEAFLKLLNEPEFKSREHFLQISATAMRYVLIDRVRRQMADKRGGGASHVPLDEVAEGDFQIENDELALAVHDALFRLAELSPRQAQVAECRYFAGYSDEEIAAALDVSVRTVRREWFIAKAWLGRELGEDVGEAAS